MKSSSVVGIRECLIVTAIALAWAALFEINLWLFSGLEHTIRAHWIFLPAVMRPLCILMFGGLGAWGLVIGAYLTVYGTTDGEYLHEIMLSVISGLLPWVAVSAGKALVGISGTLAGLRAKHIVTLCVLCAAANAVGLNAYLWMAGRLDGDLIQFLTIFIGDSFGSAIILFLISAAISVCLRSKAI